jgi:murein endopeptidase
MRARALILAGCLLLVGAGVAAVGTASGPAAGGAPARPAQSLPPPLTQPAPPPPLYAPIRYRRCRSLGLPWAGRLVRGTRLPSEGVDFFTWDPAKRRSPNRWWRRYGCDFAIKKLLRVLRSVRQEFPDAPRIGIGDLSRPRGGNFGRRFGGLGHASHQSGIDIDVYYPRWDGLERRPDTVDDVDFELAQALVARLVRAGARYVFVGPNTDLRGRRKIVRSLVHHDDHLHVRFRVPRGRRGGPRP